MWAIFSSRLLCLKFAFPAFVLLQKLTTRKLARYREYFSAFNVVFSARKHGSVCNVFQWHKNYGEQLRTHICDFTRHVLCTMYFNGKDCFVLFCGCSLCVLCVSRNSTEQSRENYIFLLFHPQRHLNIKLRRYHCL